MKKKIYMIFLSAICVVSLTGCNKEKYGEAVEAFNSGYYDTAYDAFLEVSKNYEDTSSYIEKLEMYDTTYCNALQKIDNGDYEGAISMLSELPSDYKLTEELVNGMDNLEILLTNEWEDKANGTDDNCGWEYYDTFSLLVYDDTIVLYNKEEEYVDGDYMGNYKDEISLYELLGNNVADVKCSERTNFEIDISDIGNGSYTVDNGFVRTTFIIKE